jgi:hypothetical protein
MHPYTTHDQPLLDKQHLQLSSSVDVSLTSSVPSHHITLASATETSIRCMRVKHAIDMPLLLDTIPLLQSLGYSILDLAFLTHTLAPVKKRPLSILIDVIFPVESTSTFLP